MFTKLYKFLSSLRFTIWLICLLGVIFAAGLWVPQKRLLKTIYLDWQQKSPDLVAFLDSFGLTTIYTSPITVTLWLLFFLNLSLVLWQRIPVIKSRIVLSESKIVDPESAGGYPFHSYYPLPDGLNEDKIFAALRKHGFTILGNGNMFYGVKNRLSPIAFALFHVSFFLILFGGIIGVYTEFRGYVELAQGETFQGELERYKDDPGPKLPEIGSLPDVSFTIKSIVPRVVRNTPTGISIMLVDSRGKSHEVGINVPYNTNHTSVMFKHLGVAPLFILKDSSGKEIGGAYMKLDVLKGGPDHFTLGGLLFATRFYPDYALVDGKPVTRSMEFNNQVFVISVERDGKKIAEGTVPKNGTMTFEGYRLEMQEMPFWVRFYVNKQRGLSIVYTGFALATIGVIWRLLFFRREIIGSIREKEGQLCLVVAGRSEYYKSLAEDEFVKLFSGIVRKTDER
ncbi:MAG: cytochrome c biogenesis protein ResB [Desulfuromonadales bacterium]|nr:cytochrome c biogenesis protein ResB [Desulfuromonadales bacterium]